jgi:hypothetical protein
MGLLGRLTWGGKKVLEFRTGAHSLEDDRIQKIYARLGLPGVEVAVEPYPIDSTIHLLETELAGQMSMLADHHEAGKQPPQRLVKDHEDTKILLKVAEGDFKVYDVKLTVDADRVGYGELMEAIRKAKEDRLIT